MGVFVCKLLACILGTSFVFGSSSNLFNKLQTSLRVLYRSVQWQSRMHQLIVLYGSRGGPRLGVDR